MEENNPTQKKSTIGSFLSKLIEYMMYVGTSSLLIYFLFKSVLGIPSNLKENTEIIKETQLNVDTIKGMGSFLMERFYSMEQSQSKTNQLQEENKNVIEGLSKEINSLKRSTHVGLQETNKQIRNLSSEISKIKTSQSDSFK